MPLHLIKLCVGAESVDDLRAWIDERLAAMAGAGEAPEHRHTTRMVPKRVGELMEEGSLYWVIRGETAVRQVLREVRPFTDADGIGRCHLVLDPVLVPVAARPRRPFQGWRYLLPADAPPDLGHAAHDIAAMPDGLKRELRAMGLL